MHTAWTGDADHNLYYKRFVIGSGTDPTVDQEGHAPSRRCRYPRPQVGVRGGHVVLAYTDVGRVRARMSDTAGATFEAATTPFRPGARQASRAYSADVAADRVVVEVVASRNGKQTPRRVQSQDGGATWTDRDFGHDGARIGALRKTTGSKSLLVEAWQNNATGTDTLRAQYEH